MGKIFCLMGKSSTGKDTLFYIDRYRDCPAGTDRFRYPHVLQQKKIAER